MKDPGILPDNALAIVDVVMESDTAGLEVVEYMRETLGNRATPVVLRTGQAGKAPERTVVDRYEITQYLNKVEADGGQALHCRDGGHSPVLVGKAGGVGK